MTYATTDINELLTQLKTDAETGLTDESAAKQFRAVGANKIIGTSSRKWWKILFMQFNNLLVILLIGASLLSFQLGSYRDGIVLAIIVVLNALVGFYQDWKSENIIESLKGLITEKCTVIRSGKSREIPVEDIVPGDVIVIDEGDGIAADMRLLESHSLFVNEFILTGESQASEKNHTSAVKEDASIAEQSNMVLMGTTVSKGQAKGLVVSTGMQTELGRIAGKSQQIKQDTSPLQKEINILAKKITVITLCLAVALFAFSMWQGEKITVAIVFAISIAAAMVPEGLPAQISIALALGVRRLAEKKAVVKQLSSVEALGSSTVIASDKTGTITKNEMSITSCFLNGQSFTLTGTGYAPEGQILNDEQKPLDKAQLLAAKFFFTAGYLSSTSSVNKPDEFHTGWYGMGDPTETAFCTLAMKGGFELASLDKEYSRKQLFPFDSDRKRVSIIRENSGKQTAFIKGSLENVLEVSDKQVLNGEIKPLSTEEKTVLLQHAESFAAESLRVIALAYKHLDKIENDKYTIEETESNLIFAGFAAMIDPPRDEVPQAVQDAFNAHIRIIIITGDNEITARAIAKNIGLTNADNSEPQIINQQKLGSMSDADIKKSLLQRTLVFSRVSPDDKLKIVTLLKEMGEVVAVTGDGVNDTLSLKKADIGVAMGQSGSKVAQEAAAMVLLNDDFSTIVKAIKEGRTIFNNISKNVIATLASNTAELICVLYGFIGVYFNQPIAILAIHILLIDLIGEMLPLLMLSFDRAHDNIMKEQPRKKGQLLNRSVMLQVLSSGLIRGILAVTVFNFVLYFHKGEANQHETAVAGTFITIVLTQFINIFCIRTKTTVFNHFLFSNPNLLWGMFLSLVAMFAIIYTPFFNLYLHTGPLTARDWIFPLVASLVYLIGFEIIKWGKRKGNVALEVKHNRIMKGIKIDSMKKLFYLFLILTIFSSPPAMAQKSMGIHSIMDSIQLSNPSLRMYDADIRSMDEAAKGAKSWMAPELSTGFFMVPYSPRYWKSMDEQPGMGQYIVAVQQNIPNPKRLNADYKYMSSMSSVEKEKREYTLNQLFSVAKKSYYEWIVLKKQVLIVDENEKLVEYMIQSAEIRYKNGLGKINAYYKAKASLANIQNMKIMLDNEIVQKKYIINALMYRDKAIDFEIDTSYVLKDYQNIAFDTTLFLTNRSDIKSIEREIYINTLKQETERTRLLPEFGFRFENMYGWAQQPMQFTAMAMVRIPMAPWSARMNKANIESIKWKNESLKQQKAMIINESTGMAYGMRTDILNKGKQIKLYEEKILPALLRNYKSYQLSYEQNTEELFELFDAWETLNMTQLEYLKQLQELLTMQVELERILQIK